MMPLMVFSGFSTSLSNKSLFPAVFALCTALLAVVLSGCFSSSRNLQVDYIAHPVPVQVAQQTQHTQNMPPAQPVPQSRPLHSTQNSHGDATCTSASHLQDDMLSRVNRIRATGAVCGGKRYPPAAPLRWNSKLQHAAAEHSYDMADHNFFNHKSASNGSTLPERLRNVGYRYQAAGENIGAGPTTVAQVIDMWVASPGHCVILMTANFVDLGASCKNNSNSYYKTYWTLKAATPG